jgi:hypothetical protein
VRREARKWPSAATAPLLNSREIKPRHLSDRETIALLFDMLDAALLHIPRSSRHITVRRLRVAVPLMRLACERTSHEG